MTTNETGRTFIATVDLATLGQGYAIGVDAVHQESDEDGPGGIENIFKIDIGPTEQHARAADWDSALKAHGFERTGPWDDHQGYRTADVGRTKEDATQADGPGS